MNTSEAKTARRTEAYLVPFICFMLFLAVPDVLSSLGVISENAELADRKNTLLLWLYSVQTIATLIVLGVFWRQYDFRPHKGWLLAIGAGILSIVLWILPGHLFELWNMQDGWWKYLGFIARKHGFDPNATAGTSASLYGIVLAMRFVRLVIVAPLIEELFWRGFLMRYLVDLDGDFWEVPFGTYHKRSLIVVTGLVVLVHSPADYFAALIFGLMMYGLAVRTKSLSACVLMHATANLILGLYVVSTQSWGYW